MDTCDDEGRDRKERADEVEALFAVPDDGVFIVGGLDVGAAFQEMRLAYVYGLWLSTIFNATAALERHIAGVLHMMGESVQGVPFAGLTSLAAQLGHIDHFEKMKYDELHALRDDYSSYREPIEMVERLAEAGRMGVGFNELLQADARMALTLACGYFEKNCLP